MQRIILRQLKASVHRLQGGSPPEITRYYQAYKREFRNYEKISSKHELLRAGRHADIIFGADFHPFSQSQRTHLRILRELTRRPRPVILALEAIDTKFQKHLEAYLEGKIEDKTFLNRINYSRSWGFPWENYKVLFDFARDNKMKIFGINRAHQNGREKNLENRDAYSGTQIAKLRRENPEALIYVIYGDLHMAASHLPKMTRKFLGSAEARFLTIFQNSESLYWQLAKKKLEERVDVLKLRDDAYCVVNSPPWLKWQAYLNFLEQSLDHDAGDTKDIEDYNDHVSQIVKIIAQLWGLKGSFLDFQVYTHGDVKLASYVNRFMPKQDLNKLVTFMKAGRSFFVPYPPIFYLKSANINHLAALAGQYLHAKARKEKKVHFRFPKDFVPLIWTEAIGFFASKMVNPRRKFNTVRDLPSRHQVTLLVLEQRLLDQVAVKTKKAIRIVRKSRHRHSREYLAAAQVIGALIGNKIYKAFRRGRLDQETLQLWLRKKVDSSPAFFAFYVNVLTTLKNIPVGEISKNERL
jgi:hypothetical protein